MIEVTYKAISPKTKMWEKIEISKVKYIEQARTRAISLGWIISLVDGRPVIESDIGVYKP